MNEMNEKQSQSSQLANSSEVKPHTTNPKGAGRKSKEYHTKPTQDILNLTAPIAARILQEHIERKHGRKTLKSSLQRACEYVIDHAIGKSRQKIEHSGAILTYADLAKGASELDSKPRPILADVMEIANKYDRDHPEPAPGEVDKHEEP